MKYISLGIDATDRAIHPVDKHIADLDGVTRKAILHIDAHVRETSVLYELAGDIAVFEAAMDAHDGVVGYELVDGDRAFTAYVRTDTTAVGGELVSVTHDHALIIDTPIECVDGGMKVTVVGTHDNLRKAMGDFPAELDVTVRSAGPFSPSDRGLLEPLTERQLEVFRTAVENGYYDMPRQATHKDLAGELDCSPSTVDEHLRKAEARVVSGLVG